MTETTGRTGSTEVERLLALSEGESGRAALRPYLSDPDSVVRRAAVEVVDRRRPDWAFDALCLALLDASDSVRVAAAEALRPLEPEFPDQPQLFDFLEQALDSPSVPAREIAVRLLRRTSDASVSTFVAAAEDVEPGVRREAVHGLADLGAVSEIGTLLEDDDPDVRAAARAAMATASPSSQSRNEMTD